MSKRICMVVLLVAAACTRAAAFSCLDYCGHYGGKNFKACMKTCGMGVEDFMGTRSVDGKYCPKNMSYIPAGSFIMGCTDGDKNCYGDELPARLVQITKGFCMDRFEVTQESYYRVMERNPSRSLWCGSNCPVDSVTWADAHNYCKKIGKRLPTESEWEYAAKAGTTTKFYWGGLKSDAFAWYDENSFGRSHSIGKKLPNAYALNDMAGNVAEWVKDCYDANWYGQIPGKNPIDKNRKCMARTVRGGSWRFPITGLRVSDRTPRDPAFGYLDTGFRCAQ